MNGLNTKPMEFFSELSKIPRTSGNENKVADYLVDFAAKRGLFCIRDNFNNVFIRKEGNVSGDIPAVMFQAHTDIVGEKEPDSDHDFLSDGIELCIDGGYVFANKTTLGADDGAGCAVMLALLDSDDIKHPVIECLFTSSEETGMDGAFGFDFSCADAFRIINLDSERELDCCIGCAGGTRLDVFIPTEKVEYEGVPYKITVSGLCGGHSGTDINKGRASAVKVMSSLLMRLYDDYPLHIADLFGGGRDNVIPFSASCEVAFFGKTEAKKAKEMLSDIKRNIISSLCKEDRKRFSVKLEKCEKRESMLSLKSSSALISFISVAPQGVVLNVPDTGLVESSVNLGSVTTGNDGVYADFLIRSGNAFNTETTAATIGRLAHLLGGSAKVRSSYPGWEYVRGSKLQNAYENACKAVFGKTPVFSSVHAGLECGLFYEKIKAKGKEPDIISIGPNIFDIHTPKEKMDLASFDRLYETVKEMLLNL